MTNTLVEDIYAYEKKAIESIPQDHPNYEEIRKLLIDQINDDIEHATHSKPN